MTPLDAFFFLGSTYTYLSVNRADALASKHGLSIRWRPFSVRTLMHEQNNVPFAGKPAKLAYMWRDVARRAERLGIPFNGAPRYPIDRDERANHVATLAAIEGWCIDFAQAAYRAWFLGDDDPGGDQALRQILTGLGRDADAVLAAADTPQVRERYAQETAIARELGIFGSPTFVSGREIFWGDDRLEDALAWHLASGLAGQPAS